MDAKPPHLRAMRWRLGALWTAQAARSATDACLRLFVVLLATTGAPSERESAWHLVMALFMLPCVLLAPINGALSNSLPKRRLLVGAAAYSLGLLLLFGLLGHAWLVGVALLALGSAVFVPARLALLPAAAHDTALPLARVTALIEAGAVLAMVVGMMIAVQLAPAAPVLGLPPTVLALLGLGLLGLLAALPAHFPSDVSRPESLRRALHGFFKDGAQIAANRPALAALVGLAALRGLVAIAVGALIAAVLARSAADAQASFSTLLHVALLSMIGAGLGSVLAGLPAHSQRTLALVPIAATGLALALAWVAQADAVPLPLCVVVGCLGGLLNVPLLVAYQHAVPPSARGNGMAILNTAGNLSMTLLSLLMAGLSRAQLLSAHGQLVCVAVLAALAAALAWRLLHAQVRALGWSPRV